MKPTDDVWEDMSSLPSPTTYNFQDFFAPPLRPPTTHFLNPRPPPSTTTMFTLITTSDPNKRQKPNPQPHNFTTGATSPHEYTDEFRRLMKNRESASRSRARKQARADELEHEVMRLAKENAELKRLHKEVCMASTCELPKGHSLHRTKSAPF